MKKTLTFLTLCLFMLCLWQPVSAQYEDWILEDYSPGQCSTHTLRTWHQSTQLNEGVCKVYLYYRPGTSGAWTHQQTINASYPTNVFTDFTVTQTGYYYALVWFGWITPNGPCWYGYSVNAGSQIYVQVDNSPTATYKVDGAAVNTSTYLQTYECSPLQMTNMTLSGTGTNPYWKVTVTKVGSGTVATNGWVAGTLPSSYDLKSLLVSTYGSGNVEGEYNVSVSVKNGCSGKNGNTYSGLVKINTNPTATSACFQISTNNTCSSFTNGGTACSNATSACASSPKISGACSGGQWVGGYYRVLVEEYATCSTGVTTIVNTANTPITNSGDVVCLDLNVLASSPGYWFSNPTGRKYKVSWTIGNACGETTSVRWFKDDISGCRVRGDKGDKGGDELDAQASLGERSAENPLGFTVYPNPASGELNLLWDTNTEERTTIRMFDVTGREVLVHTKAKGLGEAKLDISGLGKGIYVVELNNGTRSIQRVVID